LSAEVVEIDEDDEEEEEGVKVSFDMNTQPTGTSDISNARDD
jgi:hypothetical protein